MFLHKILSPDVPQMDDRRRVNPLGTGTVMVPMHTESCLLLLVSMITRILPYLWRYWTQDRGRRNWGWRFQFCSSSIQIQLSTHDIWRQWPHELERVILDMCDERCGLWCRFNSCFRRRLHVQLRALITVDVVQCSLGLDDKPINEAEALLFHSLLTGVGEFSSHFLLGVQKVSRMLLTSPPDSLWDFKE